MGPGEIAPALAPEPSPRNTPFQLAAGGSHTSKPMCESDVGVASPTMRQKGTWTVVPATVSPVAAKLVLDHRIRGDGPACQRGAARGVIRPGAFGGRHVRGIACKSQQRQQRQNPGMAAAMRREPDVSLTSIGLGHGQVLPCVSGGLGAAPAGI